MCLGIPLKIISIEDKEAMGEIKGIKRSVRLDFIKDIAIGDYVMCHAGFAINKMEENFARESMEAYMEVIEAMKR